MNEQADRFDFVVIGGGAAGEGAAHLALDRGASVAVIERDLFGGSCAYWACMPSKALLRAAAVHHAGGDYPWPRAAAFRDWMISRDPQTDYPDDTRHVRDIEDKGGVAIRGVARLDGPGRVAISARSGDSRVVTAAHIVLAVGSDSRIPPIDGLADVPYWTNREATSTAVLPPSLLILGGGPTGVELAQVFARYGVPTTIVDSNTRLLARDHPRNSQALGTALERDGVRVLTGVRAQRARARAGTDGAHLFELSDGSTVEGHAVLLAIGRSYPLAGLGLETIGLEFTDDGPRPDATLQIAPQVYLVGDPAGPEMHTHLAHYEGEVAVRIALGDETGPDFRAIPRATYTDPETASVGLTVEQATEQGFEVIERSADLAASAKGQVSETDGHVTVVVDRQRQTLLGAFIAGPGASEAIHEAVLAVKLQVPLHVLADTLHAFPTTARVMGTLFGAVARELAPSADEEL
ncbi:MAG TPA: NAD(P)/FAD-dependent oxidoreductase [Candidatus Caenarcaniphilales bacterium]|nr:NAD(P)/FAD-dependent oxidoreductase [Candidatus Caenarcaniphilales bacterium]